VIIAAEQGAALINTSFTEDLTLFQTGLFGAGAGTSAWAGMADVTVNVFQDTRTVKGLRPHYYAIRQLAKHLGEYQELQRLPAAKGVRLYRWKRNGAPVWVAWLDPGRLLLPGDAVPQATVTIKTGGDVVVEGMIDRPGSAAATRPAVTARQGGVEVVLTPRPVYVFQK